MFRGETSREKVRGSRRRLPKALHAGRQTVGRLVGGTVGVCVGAFVGVCVGQFVGGSVGSPVGCVVGSCVGNEVGGHDMVGAAVGIRTRSPPW